MIEPRFSNAMTLGEARQKLMFLADVGTTCPCCKQFAKIYRRRIHATMARELIRFYRVAGRSWAHVATATGYRGGDFCKLRYWGLVEEEADRREDGGRAGYWRITSRGEQWVIGHTRIPKYARIYDGRLLGVAGEDVGIRDALGKKFDYDELMRGV